MLFYSVYNRAAQLVVVQMALMSTSCSSIVMRFLRSRDGAVAVLFGIMIFVLIGLSGVAVDLSNANRVRTKAMEAIDAAVLAATNPLVPESDRISVFEATFKLNYNDAGPKPGTLHYLT